jgi:hypothetical protein
MTRWTCILLLSALLQQRTRNSNRHSKPSHAARPAGDSCPIDRGFKTPEEQVTAQPAVQFLLQDSSHGRADVHERKYADVAELSDQFGPVPAKWTCHALWRPTRVRKFMTRDSRTGEITESTSRNPGRSQLWPDRREKHRRMEGRPAPMFL